MPRKAEPKPPNRLVHTISLDGDATDKLVTWLTLKTPSGTLEAALSREAICGLHEMLDTLTAGWECDCPDCRTERLTKEAAAGSRHPPFVAQHNFRQRAVT